MTAPIQGGRRAALIALRFLSTQLRVAAVLWAAALAAASPGWAQKTDMEKFEPVDPYTKGEPAALQRAGYVTLAPDRYGERHTRQELEETLGGVSVIHIETVHFRVASTLETYKPTTDIIEKKLLEAEFKRLKEKLPKAKLGSKIDPWLRAHLYAQRLEELYADFWTRFGLRSDDFESLEAKAKDGIPMGVGPFLGQKEKFIVLLTERRSGFGRYLRTYVGEENEYSYRSRFPDCYFFGCNFEALRDNGRDLDVALWTQAAGAVVQNFLDAFRCSNQVAPEWLRYGLAHWYARRIDARWNQWGAGGTVASEDDKSWMWESRVLGLVENDAASSWDQMVGWVKYDDIKPREHMLCWSRVDWLLDQRKADARALLIELTHPIDKWGAERPGLIKAQELRAYSKIWKATPADLDRDWKAWIAREYPKRD